MAPPNPSVDFPAGGIDDGTLRLRFRTEADLESIVAACQDPEIPRWTLVPSPYRREHAEDFLALSASAARAGETATLLAVDAQGGLLGSFSLMEIDHERGYGEIEEVTSAEEHLLFALPPELRRDLRAAGMADSGVAEV